MAHTNPTDLQLPHLETFVAAAECGSFTKAARSVHLTQAAISLRIQALEKVLGKSLFDRRAGRMMLTDAGQKFYPYARRIMELHREAFREVALVDPPVTGELVLGASSIPGDHLLPAILSAFSRKYPQIRVRATASDSLVVLGQVERGEISLGLVGRKADIPHLEFRFLANDRMVLVVPPDHPLAASTQVTVSQLAAQPIILREAGSGLRHCFEKGLRKTGRSLADLKVVLELGSNEAIKEAVVQRVGVTVLSLLAVQKEIKAGELKALSVKGIRCDRDMYIVQDRRRVLPLPARLFLAFLKSHTGPTATTD